MNPMQLPYDTLCKLLSNHFSSLQIASINYIEDVYAYVFDPAGDIYTEKIAEGRFNIINERFGFEYLIENYPRKHARQVYSGIFGHELEHIDVSTSPMCLYKLMHEAMGRLLGADEESMFLRLVNSSSCIHKFIDPIYDWIERGIDRRVIKRGLGVPLYHASTFLRSNHEESVSGLSPEQILKEVELLNGNRQ